MLAVLGLLKIDWLSESKRFEELCLYRIGRLLFYNGSNGFLILGYIDKPGINEVFFKKLLACFSRDI
jgi:hypothetical protein